MNYSLLVQAGSRKATLEEISCACNFFLTDRIGLGTAPIDRNPQIVVLVLLAAVLLHIALRTFPQILPLFDSIKQRWEHSRGGLGRGAPVTPVSVRPCLFYILILKKGQITVSIKEF